MKITTFAPTNQISKDRMTTIDIIILVVIGIGVLLGLIKGALKQIAGLLGLVVGLLAARALYASVAEDVFSRVTDNLTLAQHINHLSGEILGQIVNENLQGRLPIAHRPLEHQPLAWWSVCWSMSTPTTR